MSGILDSKSRVIDAIITSEGRRQIAEGTFNVSYVTFTDSSVVYQPDSLEGHIDPTNRIYFESCNLPQDQITFEANDDGKLQPFRLQNLIVSASSDSLKDYVQASIENGKITTKEFVYGRLIKVKGIDYQSQFTKEIGFHYSGIGSLGYQMTGSIFVSCKPELGPSGQINFTTPVNINYPYVSKISAYGGISENNLALSISGAFKAISEAGGPQVGIREIKQGTIYFKDNLNEKTSIFLNDKNDSSLIAVEENRIGGKIVTKEIDSAIFSSQIQGILTSSFDNFLDLCSISTVDDVFFDNKFILSENIVEFNFEDDIKDSNVKLSLKNSSPQINNIDALFSDDKLSHLDNFMYLPPIIKTSDTELPNKSNSENTLKYRLGNYPSWGDNIQKLDYMSLENQLSKYRNREIIFKQSSRQNNIIGQLFEISENEKSVSKLDLIDFGILKDENGDSKRIFFAGKTFVDDYGSTCYVNIFTLVFSKNDNSIWRKIWWHHWC